MYSQHCLKSSITKAELKKNRKDQLAALLDPKQNKTASAKKLWAKIRGAFPNFLRKRLKGRLPSFHIFEFGREYEFSTFLQLANHYIGTFFVKLTEEKRLRILKSYRGMCSPDVFIMICAWRNLIDEFKLHDPRKNINTPESAVDTIDSGIYSNRNLEQKNSEDAIVHVPESLRKWPNTDGDPEEKFKGLINFMNKHMPDEFRIFELKYQPGQDIYDDKSHRKYIESTLGITRSTLEKAEAKIKLLFDLYKNPNILSEAEVFEILEQINARAAGIKRLIDSDASIEQAAQKKRINTATAREALEFAEAFLAWLKTVNRPAE